MTVNQTAAAVMESVLTVSIVSMLDSKAETVKLVSFNLTTFLKVKVY